MKQDKITSLQYATLTFFLVNSFLSNIGFYTISNISKNDSIFDILGGGILILGISYFIFKMHHYQEVNIIDIIDTKFSNVLKYFLIILLFSTISCATIYSLSNIVQFIHNYILKEVSTFIITTTLTMTVLYIVSKELSTISKLSEIFFYIYILIFIIGFIGLIKYMDFENLKPLFTTHYERHYTATAIYFYSSMIPLFLLLIIPKNKIKWNQKKKPYPFILLGISILLCLIQFISILAVLGIRLTTLFKNPEMIAFKKISFLNLLERMEIILSFNHILNSIFFIIMGVYFLKELLHHTIYHKKEPIILALIGFFLVLFSSFITFDVFSYLIMNIIIFMVLFLFAVRYFFHKHIHE